MRRFALLLLFAAAAGAESEADRALLRLLADDLEEGMRRYPTWATSRGDRRFDDLLEDAGPEARTNALEHVELRLRALGEIDRDELSAANRVNAHLLEYELTRRVDAARFHPWQMPVTQLGGPQTELPQLVADTTFRTGKHFADYIARLEKVPAYLAQVTANLRAGLAAGRTPPRVTLGQAAVQALSAGTKGQEKDPRLHPMWPPFDAAGEKSALAARAERAIAKGVVPAFRKFGAFLRDEYIPNCRPHIAASDSLDGPDYYASRLAHHTTLPLTAKQIHATGLAEVKRIRAEMMEVIARTDFPRPKDFAGFTEFLRTDKRFYYTDKRDLLRGYRDIAKRIDAWMPRLFGRLPRLSYGIKEMPPFLAPAAPTAYYYRGSLKAGRPGWFVANTHRLDQRPRFEMIPLTLHEAVPGHHHQHMLAAEMEGVPEWRTTRSYTAFGEGWALYAERLGLEMGDLLADPYDDFGRLSYEMWRAMRLVVDTGIHAFGWSRQKAIDYMLDNSALARENVAREVDRYISWPGQACAYKIGELKIRELRARAEKELGDKFDLRAFHDMILGEGSIPLPVLEEQAARWIERRR